MGGAELLRNNGERRFLFIIRRLRAISFATNQCCANLVSRTLGQLTDRTGEQRWRKCLGVLCKSAQCHVTATYTKTTHPQLKSPTMFVASLMLSLVVRFADINELGIEPRILEVARSK